MSSTILTSLGDPVELEDLNVNAVKAGRNIKVRPKLPSVILLDPKYGFNVGNAQRACANWGVDQLWWTGNRVTVNQVDVNDVLADPKVRAMQTKEDRKNRQLPREERMKGWANVELVNHDRPFDFFTKMNPKPRIICVEILQGTQNLFHYGHPEDAVYVFGPEDGSIPDYARHLCHERIAAPTHGCMNLAACISVVLAFRRFSLIQQGVIGDKSMDEWLGENRGAIA